MPGSARASRAAIERPETPPAQPRPNTGTRFTPGAKPSSPCSRAFQARRGDAGGGDGDHRAHVRGGHPGVRQRLARGLEVEGAGAFQVGLVALAPVAGLGVPLQRLDGAARLDAGVGEQLEEVGRAEHLAAEHRSDGGGGLVLHDGVRGDGGGHAEQLGGVGHARSRRGHRTLRDALTVDGPPGLHKGEALMAGAERLLRKRSLSLSGHATSVALEPEFWAVLEAMAHARGESLAQLVRGFDEARGPRPLASACRLEALAFAQDPGAREA